MIRGARHLHKLSQRRYYAKLPPEWTTWKGMKLRCYNKNVFSYPFYGGRGITVCARWLEHGIGFKNFMEDMGPKPTPAHTLDRIDPDGNYCKENCRWLLGAENYGSSRGCFGAKQEEDEVPF